MNPQNGLRETELIFRRLIETPPDWVLLVPVLFALAVLFLVLFYRQPEPMSALLRTLFVPPAVVKVLTVVWGVLVLAYCAVVLTVGGVTIAQESNLFNDWSVPLFLAAGVLMAYPLLLGVLGTFVLCVRSPRTLLPVAFVGLASLLYLGLGLVLKPLIGWLVILAPVVLLALVYVGMMYRQDAQSVHPLWATFLALLRCTVYGILAVVFLLPGCQTFSTQETYSKVLVLFDVSDSMLTKDVGVKGQPEQSRQDKVVAFLTGREREKADDVVGFLEQLQLKSPVTAYRFGAQVDDFNVKQFVGGTGATGVEWAGWLNPDPAHAEVPKVVNGKELSEEEHRELMLRLADLYRDLKDGTNVSGAALQSVLKESGHLLQAVIIFSDGQSNLGSSDTYRELLARAANPKRPIHVITVGVGQFRQTVGIEVQDPQAPQQARPDDKFPVRVPVFAQGLPDTPFAVNLEITRVKKDGEKWVPAGPFKKTLTQNGKFSDRGDRQFGEVSFEIDLRELSGVEANDESQDETMEGYWQFQASVPVNPKEVTTDKVHVSKRPARVLVQKRKLRVLLFAGGPTREYQFARSLFFRETQEKRVELSVYLQSGVGDNVDQDVERDRLLSQFPDRLARDTSDSTPSLTDFDVIIAIDPDWTELSPEQMKMLNRWVGGPSAGGLIFVAGPVNSYQLATPGGRKIDDLDSLCPVKLNDSRLVGLRIGHDSSRPYALNFAESAPEFSFLNLTEDPADPLKGWTEYFWDGETPPPPGKDEEPERGFYNYYPVKKLKPAARVLATFAAPPNPQVSTDGLDEQPFIVVMPYGPGKTVYLGSGEFWRLRDLDEGYHQRFWIKLARYAGSGNLSKLDEHGFILAADKAPTGPIKIEAQILGDNLLPLDAAIKPTVQVKRPQHFDENTDRGTPASFDLQAKPGDGEFNGWFTGTFKVYTPGDYTLTIPIPGAPGKSISRDVTVYKPDPERENARPNHGYLYQLATSAEPVLARLEAKPRADLQAILRPPLDDQGKAAEVNEGEEATRLFFPLESAGLIPDLLVEVPPDKVSTKGALRDLWDRGWDNETVSVYALAMGGLAVLGLLTLVVLLSALASREWTQSVLAGVALAVAVVAALALVGANAMLPGMGMEWERLPLQASGYVLTLVLPAGVGLLIAAILAFVRQFRAALALAAVSVVFALGVYLYDAAYQPDWATVPLSLSYVLAGIVGLLSLEWLIRKLLRLA